MTIVKCEYCGIRGINFTCDHCGAPMPEFDKKQKRNLVAIYQGEPVSSSFVDNNYFNIHYWNPPSDYSDIPLSTPILIRGDFLPPISGNDK